MAEAGKDGLKAFASGADTRRRHRRWFVAFQSVVRLGETELPCEVFDLSPGGACVVPPEPDAVPVGTELVFAMPGFRAIPAAVRYSADGYLGLMFLHDERGEAALARYMLAVEQARRPERRGLAASAVLRASGVGVPCTVADVSLLGARLELEETRHLIAGQEVVLLLPGHGELAASVQRIEDREIGVAFLERLERLPDELVAELAAK